MFGLVFGLKLVLLCRMIDEVAVFSELVIGLGLPLIFWIFFFQFVWSIPTHF